MVCRLLYEGGRRTKGESRYWHDSVLFLSRKWKACAWMPEYRHNQTVGQRINWWECQRSKASLFISTDIVNLKKKFTLAFTRGFLVWLVLFGVFLASLDLFLLSFITWMCPPKGITFCKILIQLIKAFPLIVLGIYYNRDLAVISHSRKASCSSVLTSNRKSLPLSARYRKLGSTQYIENILDMYFSPMSSCCFL